jgi:hypothetical protein
MDDEENQSVNSDIISLAGLALPDFVNEIALNEVTTKLIETNRNPDEGEILDLRKIIGEFFIKIPYDLAGSPSEYQQKDNYQVRITMYL